MDESEEVVAASRAAVVHRLVRTVEDGLTPFINQCLAEIYGTTNYISEENKRRAELKERGIPIRPLRADATSARWDYSNILNTLMGLWPQFEKKFSRRVPHPQQIRADIGQMISLRDRGLGHGTLGLFTDDDLQDLCKIAERVLRASAADDEAERVSHLKSAKSQELKVPGNRIENPAIQKQTDAYEMRHAKEGREYVAPSPAEREFVRVLANSYVYVVTRSSYGATIDRVGQRENVKIALANLHRDKTNIRSNIVVLPLPCPSINELVYYCHALIGGLGRYVIRFENEIYRESEQLIYAIPHRRSFTASPAEPYDEPRHFHSERAALVAVLDALLDQDPRLLKDVTDVGVARTTAALTHEQNVQDAMVGVLVENLSHIRPLSVEARYGDFVWLNFPIPKSHPVAAIVKRLFRVHIEDVIPKDLRSMVHPAFSRLLPERIPHDLKVNGFQNVRFLEDIIAFFAEQKLNIEY
jgi:hypothetical protein